MLAAEYKVDRQAVNHADGVRVTLEQKVHIVVFVVQA